MESKVQFSFTGRTPLQIEKQQMFASPAWISPSPIVKGELIEILRDDTGLYGEIWRSTEAGLSDE